MDNLLKKGLWFMFGAVVLIPLSFLFGGLNENLLVAILLSAMLLELIGLIFVILHVIKARKSSK